jgi:hypothetical protein
MTEGSGDDRGRRHVYGHGIIERAGENRRGFLRPTHETAVSVSKHLHTHTLDAAYLTS